MATKEEENPNMDKLDEEYNWDVPDVHILKMSGNEIKETFRNIIEKGGAKMSMMKNMYTRFDLPPDPKKTNGDEGTEPDGQQSPKHSTSFQVKKINVDSAQRCTSADLRSEVMKHDIVLITGMVSSLGINMGLFSTQELLKLAPTQWITVRKQVLPAKRKGNTSWKYSSVSEEIRVRDYADYQIKESEKPDPSQQEGVEIQFGTNFDLGKKLFEKQYEEINKLPLWLKVTGSTENLLNYLSVDIPGINLLQMYLKVFGSRTTARQEDNNFCSVNINVGPGITEWFAVPQEYWGSIMARICNDKKVKFLEDSWWPDEETLNKKDIPYVKFDQKPGELVFVNVGCVHWVQAKGICNNVAWNVGTVTVKQWEAAVERYEWNRMSYYASKVPMQLLSWDLARRLKTWDANLHRSIRLTLGKSLVQFIRVKNFVEAKVIREHHVGKPSPVDKEVDKEASCESDISDPNRRHCSNCTEELFGIYFVTPDNQGVCFACAEKYSFAEYQYFQEYEVDELIKWYDDFKLQR